MTDKLRKEMEEGLKARSLIEQMEPFATEYHAKLVDEWGAEPDREKRDLIWQRANAIKDFTKMLKRFAGEGDQAAKQLEELNDV